MGKAGTAFASTETQKDLTSRTQALLQQVIQNTAFLLSGLEGKDPFLHQYRDLLVDFSWTSFRF